MFNLSLDITRITAFVHRASLFLIAAATVTATAVTAYGPGFGLTTAQIAEVAAGAIAVSTFLRSLSDTTSKVMADLSDSVVRWKNLASEYSAEIYGLRQELNPPPPNLGGLVVPNPPLPIPPVPVIS